MTTDPQDSTRHVPVTDIIPSHSDQPLIPRLCGRQPCPDNSCRDAPALLEQAAMGLALREWRPAAPDRNRNLVLVDLRNSPGSIQDRGGRSGPDHRHRDRNRHRQSGDFRPGRQPGVRQNRQALCGFQFRRDTRTDFGADRSATVPSPSEPGPCRCEKRQGESGQGQEHGGSAEARTRSHGGTASPGLRVASRSRPCRDQLPRCRGQRRGDAGPAGPGGGHIGFCRVGFWLYHASIRR